MPKRGLSCFLGLSRTRRLASTGLLASPRRLVQTPDDLYHALLVPAVVTARLNGDCVPTVRLDVSVAVRLVQTFQAPNQRCYILSCGPSSGAASYSTMLLDEPRKHHQTLRCHSHRFACSTCSCITFLEVLQFTPVPGTIEDGSVPLGVCEWLKIRIIFMAMPEKIA